MGQLETDDDDYEFAANTLSMFSFKYEKGLSLKGALVRVCSQEAVLNYPVILSHQNKFSLMLSDAFESDAENIVLI